MTAAKTEIQNDFVTLALLQCISLPPHGFCILLEQACKIITESSRYPQSSPCSVALSSAEWGNGKQQLTVIIITGLSALPPPPRHPGLSLNPLHIQVFTKCLLWHSSRPALSTNLSPAGDRQRCMKPLCFVPLSSEPSVLCHCSTILFQVLHHLTRDFKGH